MSGRVKQMYNQHCNSPIFRIQMIFPKQQMKIEQQATPSLLKKQAIELIIELYLTRRKAEDVDFLRTNFVGTREFVASVGSSLEAGLLDVGCSRLCYGENQRISPNKCLGVLDYLVREVASPFFVIGLLLLVSGLIFGAIRNLNELYSSSLTLILLSVSLSLLRIGIQSCLSHSLCQSSQQKTKNNFYQVIRNGKYMQIQESQIVVGDIVELGFKEKVPATGILLSAGQIFVKEEKKPVVQLKLSLQLCVKKIQGMSMLDFKLSHEQMSLPSPIVLRGSELVKGKTYTVLVISVTEEDLLKRFGFDIEDQFCSKAYDQWVDLLAHSWVKWSIVAMLITVIFISFTQLTDFKLMAKNKSLQIQLFFQFQLKIGILLLILNPTPLTCYLGQIFIKLMNEIKVIENFQKLFTVQRILCNERKIIEHDQINGLQVAVCDKMDLISLAEIRNLSRGTFRIIERMREVFNIRDPDGERVKDKVEKYRRIVHVFKKDLKIVSVLSADEEENCIFREVTGQLAKISADGHMARSTEHRNTLHAKKQNENKSKMASYNFLKLPSMDGMEQIENLKDIIHSKCMIKSRIVLDGLAGLVENDLKTYHFQLFDLQALQQIKLITIEGKARPITTQHKQRLVMLSRKMSLVYNLTPIMLSYNEGPLNESSPRILICIIGVTIAQDNEIIGGLGLLERVGVRPVVLVDAGEGLGHGEEAVVEEYRSRGWVDGHGEVADAGCIRDMLSRLVCKQCWIANCDCKQKIEVATNIQPFIETSEHIRLIHSVNDGDHRYLESAYSQVCPNMLSISSVKGSASDTVSSIFSCLRFLAKLRRSLIFIYALTLVGFFGPVIGWVRDVDVLGVLQIGGPFLMLMAGFTNVFLLEQKGELQRVRIENDGNIKVISKEATITAYIFSCLVITGIQLLPILHDKIPEYPDNYDLLIHKYSLSFETCKYGPSGSITAHFLYSECETPELGLQYSRLSTLAMVYLYFCLWAFGVRINRNFKSVPAVFLYLLTLLLFILIVERAPFIIHGYSYGLTWQHYLITSLSAIATLLLGQLLGLIIKRVPLVNYFEQDIETSINFSETTGQRNYISKLRHYGRQQKWEKSTAGELELRNIFNNP